MTGYEPPKFPDEDAIEWARRETIRIALAKFKRYALLLFLNCALIALICRGMPFHDLAPLAGFPLTGCAMYLLTLTVFHGGVAFAEKLNRPKA